MKSGAPAIPDDLMDWLRQYSLHCAPLQEPVPKFVEGWSLHRRGFPITALVSLDAKRGWYERNRMHPQERRYG